MGDNGPCKSVFDRICDCVNNGFSWTATQIKSACPHKRKKMLEENGDGEKYRDGRSTDEIPNGDPRSPGGPGTGSRSSDDPRSPGGPGTGPGSSDGPGSPGAPGIGPGSSDDPSSSETPGTGPQSPYDSPDKICPSMKPQCFIRMQDPLAPCCCETKPKPPPCPPRHGPQEQREPICDCDLCQKNPYHEKCCDKSKPLRGIPIDRGYFEKA